VITKGIVVAVGGNALIKDKHQISVESQSDSIMESSECIAALVDAGYTPVITHGNGPQVGFLLRRAELALSELPALPLDVLGADTQGATGYLFSRNLRGCLADKGIDRQVVAVVTQSLVDPDDPAFAEPSKPIGSFMSEEEAREHEEKDGWVLREDSGRGWRRVVASPQPLDILERQVIGSLVDSGCVVVACGGGIVLKAENRRLIAGQFLVVFLDVSVRRQILRIGRDRNRPLVQEAENLQAKLEQLRDERLGLYEGLADIRVDTDNNHFTNSFKKLLHDVENRLRREK